VVTAQDHGQRSAKRAAEHTARASYGRLLALLACRSGDLAGAEDALAEAFHAALATWPTRGVPDNPGAWLLTTARHRHLDMLRSAAQRNRVIVEPEALDLFMAPSLDNEAIPDERLKLMFVCAHPAIDAAVRTPLMLQTVLGLEAEAIARAFLLPPSTLAQRLVRAKRKIKEAGIGFVLPDRSDISSRLEAVLEAVYAAFAVGWDQASEAVTDDGTGEQDLSAEALFLAELLAQLCPEEPEALGLAATITLAHARRAARNDAAGHYVPLQSQDTRLWDTDLIASGEALLRRASAKQKMGRFQLEAAIQSVHVDRARSGHTDWPALALLYEGLMRLAPSVGTAVARAVAVAYANTPGDGLAALDTLAPNVRENYQPAWAARAHLLVMAGRVHEAADAFQQAAALARDARVSHHLLQTRAALLAIKTTSSD
jgi:predicted RNA polymerase sigma factor